MAVKKIGIIRFLGTNCDRDVYQAVENQGLKAEWLWYQDHFRPSDYDAFIIPGGFSYGDYLRCGALAAKAPAMQDLSQAAQAGQPILGICNGFQILCEAKLLPGALVRNQSLRFVDSWVELQLSHASKFFAGEKLKSCRLPVAHGEGRFFAEEDEVKRLQDNGQVWWTYVNNPNGSCADIAGVMNEMGNVAALMPHPERAVFDWMGGDQGSEFFKSLVG